MVTAADIPDAPPAPAETRRETLDRLGYLTLDTLITADDVAELRAVCTRLFDSRAGFREGQQFNMVGADDGEGPQLTQILNPHEFAPELLRTRAFREACELARELIGPDVRLAFDHAIKKPAHDGAATPWHQDEAFREPEFDYFDVSVWLPLQDVDEKNGCMRFAPGVGLDDVLPHRSAGGDPHAHALECVGGFDPATSVACPIPAGGCTVHTGRTVHGAGPNATDAPRYAYVLVFERPKRPRQGAPRSFPWRAAAVTPRAARERAWGRSVVGVASRAVRRVRRFAGRFAL